LVFNLPQLDVHLSYSVFMCLDFFETNCSNFINILKHAFVFDFQIDNLASDLSLDFLALNFFLIDLKFDLSFFRLELIFSFPLQMTYFFQLCIQFSLSNF